MGHLNRGTTMSEVATVQESTMSQLILKGDISKLNDNEKVQYYHAICQRLGVDPMTKPFDYLVLQGKQTLYLNKSGAEQLNKVHKVSIEIRDKQKADDIYVVTARASTIEQGSELDANVRQVRYTESTGAVNIKGLYGDPLCNAMMKAETKAKRRATISLLGLAMLDETETETIPGAKTEEAKVEILGETRTTGEQDIAPGIANKVTPDDWAKLDEVSSHNHWPKAYVKTWLEHEKRKGRPTVDIYQDALVRFGVPNEESQPKKEVVV